MMYLVPNKEDTVVPQPVEGFRVRVYRDEDVAAYSALRVSVNFGAWDAAEANKYRYGKAVTDGMLVCEELSTGKLVASASLEHSDYSDRPDIGGIGWVMADPAYQGKRLGRWVCEEVQALAVVHPTAFRRMVLLTDDFRLAAIALYLKTGWVPLMFEEDMPGRWQEICRNLKRDYATLPKMWSIDDDIHC